MKKRIIIISLLVVVFLSFFIFKKDASGNASDEVEFVKAQRGDMVITLKESGFLNAVEEITIKNEIAFKELSILELVDDGAFVSEGDFLIELDSEPLEQEKIRIENLVSDRVLALTEAKNTYEITESKTNSEVNTANNNIEFARLDLEKFDTLDKVTQLDESLQSIDIAEDEMKFSEQTYKASVELAEKGFETKSKVDRDKLDLSAKEKAFKSSRSKYEALKNYDLRKEKLELTRALEEANSKYERTQKEGDNEIQKAKAQLENAKSRLASAELELESIIDQLSKTIIRAPVTGYALYPQFSYWRRDRKITKGKSVRRNESLMRIPDMRKLKVDIEVAEHFISDLKEGQKAIITIDSLKDQQFSGVLSKVGLLPLQEQGFGNQSGVQKYKVVIDVIDDSLPSTIKPQISASTEVILDTLKDVLSVPIQAVHTIKGKQTVYVRSGGGGSYQAREVSIGKMDTSFIQIIKGIDEGDEVLISEPGF